MTLITSKLSRNILIFYSVFISIYSCNRESKVISFQVKPFEFSIYENEDTIRGKFEKQGIGLYYDDSYYKQDEGVKYFFFWKEENNLYYSVELFFLDKQLNGVKISIDAKTRSADQINKQIDESIMPTFRKGLRHIPSILVDTLEAIEPKGHYIIYVRTNKLDQKMK
jgi:hypothetical protein